MNFNKYIQSCLERADQPTENSLLIGGDSDLANCFRYLIKPSEETGVERGLNLEWKANKQEVEPGLVIPGTSGTAVDLKTREVNDQPSYIGDCHTHPYRLKMGDKAQIGPSSSDYQEWWVNPPQHFPIAIHFVISGSTIFLLFVREKTQKKLAFIDFSDTERLNKHVQDDENFNAAFIKAIEAGNNDKGFALQRQAWAQFAPDAATEFTQDNLKMNVLMAEYLGFEYYMGDLDKGGVPSSCRLNLVSKPVYR